LAAPRFRTRVRKYFLTGLAALLPTVMTIYLVVKGFTYLDTIFKPFLNKVLKTSTPPPFLGFAVTIVLVFVVGLLLATFVGRRLYRLADASLAKMPLIRHIYPYVKQVTDFVLEEKKIEAKAVVAVEYPRRGAWSIGLITGHGFDAVRRRTGEEMVSVFMVSSPAPFTGYVVMVPRREVVILPITVDQALRFTISGGVVGPDSSHALLDSLPHEKLFAETPGPAADAAAPQAQEARAE